MSAALTIISPLSWIQEAFKDYFDKAHMSDSSHSDIVPKKTATNAEPKAPMPSAEQPGFENPSHNWTADYDYGFEPDRGIVDGTAVWITADMLIANNAWRTRHDLSPLLFEAPTADWLAGLPQELTQRTIITLPASEIRAWDGLPEGLGERPWSQLSRGRVPEFRAARRNLHELQHDLNRAPSDSLITVNSHLDGISEEWCVIVNSGKAVASSGYCIHRSASENSHDILTVFDGARFHDSYREVAERLAAEAAQASRLDCSSIIVGFRQNEKNTEIARPSNPTPQDSEVLPSPPQPVIIEADPVWCTTPYPYESAEDINAFLQAISDSRIYKADDGGFKNGNGQNITASNIYTPDPWMVRHATHRYDRF